MFARTQRLLLRPGFPEDAPALLAAMADERVVLQLARAPWPFRLADAEAFLSRRADPLLPSLLVLERTGGPPRLVGGCGLTRRQSGTVQLGYWVSRPDWNRGIATEAASAMVDIARALRLPALEASHFLDNPRSGRILEKLGFEATGMIAPRLCEARGEELPARFYRLRLQQDLPVEMTIREQILAA